MSSASTGSPAAPIPAATTDSPMATMTTSPWRSTKWPGAISKLLWLSRLPTHGVDHSRTAAAVHSTACAVPPSAPPTMTSAALKRLYGAMPRKAREDCADAVQMKSEAWTAVTMK